MEVRDTVRMANQIGDFFASYPEKEALDGIAEHINKFWEPRMRRIFFAHLDAGGEGVQLAVGDVAHEVGEPAAVALPQGVVHEDGHGGTVAADPPPVALQGDSGYDQDHQVREERRPGQVREARPRAR